MMRRLGSCPWVSSIALSGLLVTSAGCKGIARARVHDVAAASAPVLASRVTLDLAGDELATGGDGKSPLTLVSFVDLDCPHSADQLAAARALVAARQDLRVVLKLFPRPGKWERWLAARALVAAQRQGRGWEMLDALFAQRDRLTRANLLERAKGLGLDLTRFGADIDGSALDGIIRRDHADGERLGIAGTPSSFLNGRYLRGSVDKTELGRLCDDERSLLAELFGAKLPDDVYGAVMQRANRTARVEVPPPATDLVDLDARYRVPVSADDGHDGPADALVTLVTFVDVACPASRRLLPTLHALRTRYGDDLRIVWKHRPLEVHPQAFVAHEALATQAADPAKFVALLDRLFADKGQLDRARVLDDARAVGIDSAVVQRALDGGATRQAVQHDLDLGAELGVDGTPFSYINGRPLRGSEEAGVFARLIDEELERARFAVAAGTARARVYDAVTATALSEANAVNRPYEGVPTNRRLRLVPTVNDPSRGAPRPLVTIVWFVDFQTDADRKAAPVIAHALERHRDDVRVVLKLAPAPLGTDSRTAAAAAIAAGELGKLWPMADWMLAQTRPLNIADLTAEAVALGLDKQQFLRVYNNQTVTDARILQAEQLVQSLMITATPVVFVNGRVLDGPLTESNLEELVASERLEAARVARASGLEGEALYEHILDSPIAPAELVAR